MPARRQGDSDPDVWEGIRPGEVLRRQGELQRHVNRNERAIIATRAEVRRVADLVEARIKAHIDRDHEDIERRILALEQTQGFWLDPDNVTAEIARLGIVTLTPEQRAVLTKDITEAMYEKQHAEREKARSRLWDSKWSRGTAIAGGLYIGYQVVFGGTPLLTVVKGILHIP